MKTSPKIHYSILTLLLSLLSLSCKNNSKEIFSVNADVINGGVDIKLSDILEDIRLIPIETSEEFLVNHFNKVSSKYIIASNKEEIHLFDINGKHLRKLLNKGRGPEEYNDIASFLIDDDKDILYFTEYFDQDLKKIRRMDLLSGKHLDPISTRHNSLDIIDRYGNIWGCGSTQYTGIVNKENEKLPPVVSKHSPDKNEPDLYYANNPIHLQETLYGKIDYFNEKIYFANFCDCDTLYTIDKEGEKRPLMTITIPEYSQSLNHPTTDFNLITICKSGMIFEKSKQKPKNVVVLGAGITINALVSRQFLLIDYNGSVKEIRNFKIDPFDYNIDMIDFEKKRVEKADDQYLFLLSRFRLRGDWGYIEVEPFKFFDLVNMIRKEGKMEKSKLKVLEDIYNQIDEESNPILMVGKKRV